MISLMYFSSVGSSSWIVALTTKTSRSGAMLPAILAMLMLVWSFTAPIAFRIVLGAIDSTKYNWEKFRFREWRVVPLRVRICGGNDRSVDFSQCWSWMRCDPYDWRRERHVRRWCQAKSLYLCLWDEMTSCGDWLYSMGRTRSVKWIRSKNI